MEDKHVSNYMIAVITVPCSLGLNEMESIYNIKNVGESCMNNIYVTKYCIEEKHS